MSAKLFHQMVMTNHVSAIRPMSEWLEARLREMGIADDLVFKFDLCANEAVTNVISYGYPQGGEHQIELLLSLDGDALTLEIIDDGVAYNPLERPPHEQPQDLEHASIGGLGVDLIRKMMDECHYSRSDGRNVLAMLSRLPA